MLHREAREAREAAYVNDTNLRQTSPRARAGAANGCREVARRSIVEDWIAQTPCFVK